ncbi:MAG: sulfate adenylyltransferase, partial [Hyphomicrobiales bacterium]|nr:sulfate adenylyltransferase [Hyphomicrobiales bacterium]
MSNLVNPHGGSGLKSLLAPQDARADMLAKAQELQKVPMTSRELSDLFMLGMGAYTPLGGFMGEADWRGVCTDMKLASGLFWPIPITLSASNDIADAITAGSDVALTDGQTGEVMGVMRVEEKYKIDKTLECESVYKTADEAHPGVQKVLAQGEVNLAGPVTALSEGEYPGKYPDLYYRPAESRALFAEKGWSKVAAFQTRNPMHRSHEYLAKIAVEVLDGVFIHQVLGALKPGDIPAETRTQAIQAMIDNYFVPG